MINVGKYTSPMDPMGYDVTVSVCCFETSLRLFPKALMDSASRRADVFFFGVDKGNSNIFTTSLTLGFQIHINTCSGGFLGRFLGSKYLLTRCLEA